MIQKKVCLVGTSGVGKTSLVAKFVHSIFSDKYLTTVGVKIDKKTVTVDGNEVMLMIWDLAGDDDYQRLQTRDADVVIADSQYDAIEYPSRRGWGHTCADDTVQLAARAGAKQLSLFHHDPDHDDGKIAEMVACGQREVARSGASLRVGAASEGAEIKLARAISL